MPSDKALYTQVIAHYRTQILDGTLPPGARLPTELEIAEMFNISRGTVRQAMTAMVNEGLLERVPGRGTFVHAERQPDDAIKPTNRRIGLLLSYRNSELDLHILSGVEHTAKSRGYQVSFAYTEESAEEQSRDINHLRADGVSGLIIYPLSNRTYDDAIAKLHTAALPFVLIDRYLPEINGDYVTSDNVGGGYSAAQHLIILGHTRIAFCYSTAGTLLTTSVRDRLAGYRKALHEYGLPYDESLVLFRSSEKTPQEAYTELLARPDRPTAIFAANDSEAIQIIATARQLGIRIPDDLALVGFDNLRLTEHTTPPLTTVAQPARDIGARAADLLISRIEGQPGVARGVELPTHLVIRESCGVKLRIKSK